MASVLGSRSRTHGQARQRQAEADQIDRDDGRQAAEQVHVGGGDQAHRQAGCAGRQPRDGDDEPPGEHQHFGHDEDLHVDPEGAEDQRKAGRHQRPEKEGAADRDIVGDEEQRREVEDQHRRRDADRIGGRRVGLRAPHPRLGHIGRSRRGGAPRRPNARERRMEQRQAREPKPDQHRIGADAAGSDRAERRAERGQRRDRDQDDEQHDGERPRRRGRGRMSA